MLGEHDASRIYHCTFYKCGSQWVRDVLTDPTIVAYSQAKLLDSGRDVPSAGWPTVESAGVVSPLYTAGIAEWQSRLEPRETDKCLIVLRDPRDVIVSFVKSLANSHVPNETTSLLRLPLRHASRGDRIRMGIHFFLSWAEQFRSWVDHERTEPDELRLDYAALIADEQGQFRRIFAFLNWQIPDEVVTEVVARHSFVATSGGRQPGEENEHSHRRKGVSGDWRNHFTRETGKLLEATCPGLLRAGGYVEADNWWESLAEEAPVEETSSEVGVGRLLAVMEEQETQLRIIRQAAEQRAHDVEELHGLNKSLRNEVETYRIASEERLRALE